MNSSIQSISLGDNDINIDYKDKKCAPGVKFESGSCIDLTILKEMVKAYNKENPKNKIEINEKWELLNPSKFKKILLHELKEKNKQNCSDQICWTHQSFINHLNDKVKTKLKKFTFRPKGPEGKFEWLSNHDIEKALEQYQNSDNDFYFLGAVPIDFDNLPHLGLKNLNLKELEDKGFKKLGIVFNTDEHYKSGEHWICCFINLLKRQIYFFDSVGIRPEIRIRKFIRKIAHYFIDRDKITNIDQLDIRYNKKRHQYKNSECGVFCIYYLSKMLEGYSFDDITSNNNITDKDVNKYREIFFL
jgi:hypothetical protein